MASFHEPGSSSNGIRKQENSGKKTKILNINPYDKLVPYSTIATMCTPPGQNITQGFAKSKIKSDRKAKHQQSEFLKSPPVPVQESDEDGINSLLSDLSLSTGDTETTGVPSALYYGWFFKDDVRDALKEISAAYITECYFSVPQFERFLTSACAKNGGKDPISYYRYPAKSRKLRHHPDYHVTSKFCGREIPECKEYWSKVAHLIDTSSPIYIIGLFFTEKTYGFRVKLSEEQKLIFDERNITPTHTNVSLCQENNSDDANNSARSLTVDVNCTMNSEFTVLTKALQASKDKDKKRKNSKSSKEQKLVKSEYHPNILVGSQEKNFCPSNSRAHITIGTGPLVNAFQTGEDLKDLVNLETRLSSSSMFYKDYVLENGDTLRQFGRFGDAFILYLNKMFVTEGIFNFKL